MHAALIVARAIHFSGAIGAFGAAAFRLYGLDRAAAGADVFDRRLVRWIALCAAVALVGAAATVPCVAAGMAGSAAAAFDPSRIATVLTATGFGHVWCWHLALSAGLVLSAAACGAGWRGGLAFLAAASLGSLGFVGHAAIGVGWAGLGRELNQAAHVLAAGAWLGGLPPLLWLLHRARRPADGAARERLREALPHFSQMGYVAVGVLALTGSLNTVLLVGSARQLATTPYGRLLAVKIALYLAMVALAGINRFALVPRVERAAPASLTRLARTVAAEQALGLLIVAAVSVLGTLPPAIAMSGR